MYVRVSDVIKYIMAVASDTLLAKVDSLVTKHLYYDNTELFSCTGTVIAQYAPKQEGARDSQQVVLVLDETVMHPQGGRSTLTVSYYSQYGDGRKY